MSNSIEALRTAVRNEALPLNERKIAAEHFISATLDAIPEPVENDPEVLARMTPPASADGLLGDLHMKAWKIANEVDGFTTSGPTSAQSRRFVHERLRLRALLTAIVDGNAHRLKRLEACRVILEDHLHPQNLFRKNQYTPEHLLAKVLPATAYKWTAKGKVPVDRPPQTFADVW